MERQSAGKARKILIRKIFKDISVIFIMSRNVSRKLTARIVEGKSSEYIFVEGLVYRVEDTGDDIGEISHTQRPDFKNDISPLENLRYVLQYMIRNGKVPENFTIHYFGNLKILESSETTRLTSQ